MLESETVIYVGAQEVDDVGLRTDTDEFPGEEKCRELLIEDEMATIDEEAIRQDILEKHPELVLKNPIYLEDIWCGRTNMNESEDYFAEMLLERGVFLYREPKIKKIPSRFDFFAYNPRSRYGGILIEITTSKKSKIWPKKKKQLENLELVQEMYGIRGIVFFKSDLVRIANSCSDALLSVL